MYCYVFDVLTQLFNIDNTGQCGRRYHSDWVVVVELLDVIVAGTVCCWLHVLVCFTIDVDFLRCVYFNAVFFD